MADHLGVIFKDGPSGSSHRAGLHVDMQPEGCM